MFFPSLFSILDKNIKFANIGYLLMKIAVTVTFNEFEIDIVKILDELTHYFKLYFM